MNARARLFAACFAVFFVVFSAVAFYEKRGGVNPSKPQSELEHMALPMVQTVPRTPADTEDAPADTEKEPLSGGGYYVVKSYSGKLAVYRVYEDGTRTIASIVDMDVSTLPAQDVKSLKTGIVLDSEEDLIRLLEDYMS